MAVDKNIILNITTGQTIISKDNPRPQKVVMKYGDTDHIKFQMVRAADSGVGAVTVIDATGLSCQLGLSSASGVAAITSATATDPADNTHKWTLDLPLNVAAVGTLATAAGIPVVIEALIGGVQRFEFEVILKKQVLTGSTTDTPAPDVSLGRNEANLTFKKLRPTTSQAHYEIDEVTGQLFRVSFKNGEYQAEEVT